jgi:hypothetical protein
MAGKGYRNAPQQSFQDTFNFLTWEQFPAILDRSIEYFAALPQVGIYQHFNSSVKSFDQALLDNNSRQYTLSGVGSLIDYDRFGHQIKRPSPQLAGSGCEGTTLCLEPTCFGFTEGVIESNNVLQNMCWSLSLPCLKDFYYSDRMFERKMKAYFRMFFQQAPAVMQAYQRTRLLKEAIKVVCTDQNLRFVGSVFGGQDGLSLPFYINPSDATEFPSIDDLPTGVNIGGANLHAFMQYLAPRLFHDTFGGVESVKVYGLKHDYSIAKEQTASVMDHMLDIQQLAALRALGNNLAMEDMLGEFTHDGLFPTFKVSGADNRVEPITQEVLEPSTIAGYQQTANPEHALAQYRGLLLVPDNWKFDLVEPPKDNFSDLGMGQGLNFVQNTPGVFPVLSSSLFTGRTVGEDGQVIIGQTMAANGMLVPTVKGTRARERAIREAIRTEVIQTYTQSSCANSLDGQIPEVGRPIVPQGRADGFQLKSTAYFGTDVRGTAKPVLILFKTDTPRSARPIEVCTVSEVNVDESAEAKLVSCCPGNLPYAILTFSKDVSDDYAVNDLVVYRAGRRGASYTARVTAVAGSVVTIQATDAADADDLTASIPCCEGSQNDDYGTLGELFLNKGASITATSSEIRGVQANGANQILELWFPLAASTTGATGTITLENGDVILVETVADAEGIAIEVTAQAGEQSLEDLDCNCLVNAVLALD